MPPDLGPMLATLRHDDVQFVVIGPAAARARGAALSREQVEQLVLDIVPDTRDDNPQRLAAVLGQKCDAKLRISSTSEPLPIVLDTGTFTRLPILPLTSTVGDLNVVLHPPGALPGYAQITTDASELEIDGVPVQVASIPALLLGLAGGSQPADPGLLSELCRVDEMREPVDTVADSEAGQSGAAPEQTGELELAIETVLARQAMPTTIREIFLALGGPPNAAYNDVRRVAEDLTVRGRLLRERSGTAYYYRINEDYEAHVARQIALLLATTTNPSATVRRAMELIPGRPDADTRTAAADHGT